METELEVTGTTYVMVVCKIERDGSAVDVMTWGCASKKLKKGLHYNDQQMAAHIEELFEKNKSSLKVERFERIAVFGKGDIRIYKVVYK